MWRQNLHEALKLIIEPCWKMDKETIVSFSASSKNTGR